MSTYNRHRPTRAEINAAHSLWMYAPPNQTDNEKDKSMPKTNAATKPETETTETSLATRDAAPLAVTTDEAAMVAGSASSMTLANLSEEAVLDALETLRTLDLAFSEFTPIEKICGMDVNLWLTDVRTIVIANKKPRPGEDAMKPVHVFTLETAEGLTVNAMLGVNGWRDKRAAEYAAAALLNMKVRQGPVKLDKMDTGEAQPAWVFRPQPGFETVKMMNGQRIG